MFWILYRDMTVSRRNKLLKKLQIIFEDSTNSFFGFRSGDLGSIRNLILWDLYSNMKFVGFGSEFMFYIKSKKNNSNLFSSLFNYF